MLNIIRKNSWFFVPYFTFFVIVSVILLLFEKREIHLFINSYHANWSDFFFKYITHLGDGIVIGVFIFILLFIRYRHALVMLFSTLTITLIVQAFKRFILPDIDRPAYFFYESKEIYYVPGIYINTSHSFPSGHTATAFTMFLFLTLISKNKNLKLLFFIAAFLTGFSRVYLSQHFLNDIYFSSIFAIIVTCSFYFWGNNWKNKKFDLSLLHTIRIKR